MYHRQGIDEVTVNSVQRARVVVRRSADRGEIDSLRQRIRAVQNQIK